MKTFRSFIVETKSTQWKGHAHYDKSGDGTQNTGAFAGTTVDAVRKHSTKRNEYDRGLDDEDRRVAVDRVPAQKSPALGERRHYFKIPFKDKDSAKKKGYRWDPEEKHWYLKSHIVGTKRDEHKGKSYGPNNDWHYSHTKDMTK